MFREFHDLPEEKEEKEIDDWWNECEDAEMEKYAEYLKSVEDGKSKILPIK